MRRYSKGKSLGNIPSPLSGFVFRGAVGNYLVYSKKAGPFYLNVKLVNSSRYPVEGKANFWLAYNLEEKRWNRTRDCLAVKNIMGEDQIQEVEKLLVQSAYLPDWIR